MNFKILLLLGLFLAAFSQFVSKAHAKQFSRFDSYTDSSFIEIPNYCVRSRNNWFLMIRYSSVGMYRNSQRWVTQSEERALDEAERQRILNILSGYSAHIDENNRLIEYFASRIERDLDKHNNRWQKRCINKLRTLKDHYATLANYFDVLSSSFQEEEAHVGVVDTQRDDSSIPNEQIVSEDHTQTTQE